MGNEGLFCALASTGMADFIRQAQSAVCFAGPGIQVVIAQAIVDVASRLGPEMITVCLDFDERVMRMGYGAIKAVELLRDAGIAVRSAPGMRIGLVIADARGFVFTPTPLYLESEPGPDGAPNAIRISGDQVAEAMTKLSPAAKAIAVAQAKTPEEKQRVADVPVDVGSQEIGYAQFADVSQGLKEAPPVPFDLARQVRVFEPYLQYVELSLTGAAIQRHRLAIPPSVQGLGGSADLEGRLHTNFDLIQKGGKLSSKPLEDALNLIRKNLTPSLGKDHGRVVLKSAKPLLAKRLTEFRAKLAEHQKTVAKELQKHLDESCAQVVDYYKGRVVESPPDSLRGQMLAETPTAEQAERWLKGELAKVFPKADELIQEMKLDERYKDVTYETLNRGDFLELVKVAFPAVDWDKAYGEFRAAGERAEVVPKT